MIFGGVCVKALLVYAGGRAGELVVDVVEGFVENDSGAIVSEDIDIVPSCCAGIRGDALRIVEKVTSPRASSDRKLPVARSAAIDGISDSSK